jgi:hypothetical protein
MQEPLDSSLPLLAVRHAPGAMFVLNDNFEIRIVSTDSEVMIIYRRSVFFG